MLQNILDILVKEMHLVVDGVDFETHTIHIDGGRDDEGLGARSYVMRSLRLVAAEGETPEVIELPCAHANVVVKAFGGYEVVAQIY